MDYKTRLATALVQKEIRTHGYVRIESETLGCLVAWKSDADVKVPEGMVAYTMEEVVRLMQAGCDPDALRQIHAAKRLGGGQVERVITNKENHDVPKGSTGVQGREAPRQ